MLVLKLYVELLSQLAVTLQVLALMTSSVTAQYTSRLHECDAVSSYCCHDDSLSCDQLKTVKNSIQLKFQELTHQSQQLHQLATQQQLQSEQLVNITKYLEKLTAEMKNQGERLDKLVSSSPVKSKST